MLEERGFTIKPPPRKPWSEPPLLVRRLAEEPGPTDVGDDPLMRLENWDLRMTVSAFY